MSEIDFSIIGPTGESLRLASEMGEPGSFRLMNGVLGFGAPPVNASYAKSSRTGARLRHVRVGPRDITMPVGVEASSRTDMWQRQTRLERVCTRLEGLPLPRLRAAFNDGRTLELPFVTLAGFEDTYGTDGDRWHVWPLEIQAPHPYWRSTTYQSFTVENIVENVDLLDDLAAMVLMPSTSFGQIDVENSGTVPVWPTWRLEGPFTRAVIGGVDGQFVLDGTVLAGQRIVVARDEASRAYTVVDSAGGNRYDMVASAPRFPQLMPGTSTMTIELEGSTTDSRVVCSFRPEFRSVY